MLTLITAADPHAPIDAASQWVLRFADHVVPGGNVLDVACGGGRHARLFADRGHHVDALDRDIDQLSATLLVQPADITPVQADIEAGAWPFPGVRYAAVVVTNYLHRPLFPLLLAAVEPGGLLIYETFALGNEQHGRPSRAEFLLQPGELLDCVRADFKVLAYENGYVATPKAAVVQRVAARRSVT